MKKIILSICVLMFYSNIALAEKVECELLSSIQKKIYKAYCQAEAKKMGSTDTKTGSKSTGGVYTNVKEKTGSLFKKMKVNTDSKLFKTGKYSEK